MREFTEQDLKPFQRIGVDFLAAMEAAYLGDQMRLGKSVQSICAVNKLGAERILVTCPASVKLPWEGMFGSWGDRDYKCDVVFGVNAKINPRANVTILNYDLLVYPKIFNQLRKMKFDVGIFDEAHYLKGRKSKRTKRVLQRGGIAQMCDRKWFMSGTPMLNRPVELYPILASCAPKVIAPYDTYEKYIQRFCGGYWDEYDWYDKGSTHREDLNRRLHSGFMLRRTRKDVGDEMPEPECELVPIPASGKMEKLTAKELKWTSKDAKYQSFEDMEGELATVRREIAMEKLPHALQHVKYLLTATDKVVVFAYHRDMIKGLAEGLKAFNPVVIHGGVGTKRREERRKQFQEDPNTRLIVGQFEACGEGNDFSAADVIFFAEIGWVPGKLEQPMARCDHITKTQKVLIQFLVRMESVEEHMLRTVIDKMKNIKETIEDDDDIAYMFT